MIYYLTQGRKFVDSYQGNTFWGYKKQMENLAELIKEHIDQAIPYFGDNFYLYRDKLKFSQREYNNKYMEYNLKKTK